METDWSWEAGSPSGFGAGGLPLVTTDELLGVLDLVTPAVMQAVDESLGNTAVPGEVDYSLS